MPLGSNHMTDAGPVDSEVIAKTHPGMAHFADTGPRGKTCGDCLHRGYRRESQRRNIDWQSVGRGEWPQDLPPKSYRSQGCAKFHSLTGIHGAPVGNDWKACKYFEASKP